MSAPLPPLKMSKMLPERLARWAPQLRAAAACYEVDPYTLAAILDRESLGGEALRPRGPSGIGDGGHGHGLAQIDDRSHTAFLMATFDDGSPLWSDATFNILYAARLLRRALDGFDGDYMCAVASYNAGSGRVSRELRNPYVQHGPSFRRARLNSITTGGDYVDDVLRRRANFLGHTPDSVPTDGGVTT